MIKLFEFLQGCLSHTSNLNRSFTSKLTKTIFEVFLGVTILSTVFFPGGLIAQDKTNIYHLPPQLVPAGFRMVPEEHFKMLATVARQKRAPNDDKHQTMLYNLSVLEYMNGDRWCDVHPAVRELPEFKDAWRREEEACPSG